MPQTFSELVLSFLEVKFLRKLLKMYKSAIKLGFDLLIQSNNITQCYHHYDAMQPTDWNDIMFNVSGIVGLRCYLPSDQHYLPRSFGEEKWMWN